MPGRIFFRDDQATVTSNEFVIGERVFPLREILSARAVKRRSVLPLLQPSRFALIITTANGECEVLRERNGYVVFQLERAIAAALRTLNQENSKFQTPSAKEIPIPKLQTSTDAGSLEFGV
jgi:hypothetical protein